MDADSSSPSALASAQLRWLVSWDGFKHAFRREQPGAEFAVTALCRHIAQTSTVHKGQAHHCLGCLVALAMTGDVVVRVHRGIDDDGRDTWDVCLDGPAGSIELLHTAYSEDDAARLADTVRAGISRPGRSAED